MAMRKRDDEAVFPNAAGIDVGASSHWVAVPKHLADEPVREFGAMTDDLNALADWLLACGVDTVALESTGVYWIPTNEVLEQRGLKVWLVDARQMKYVPGRKSDVQDCQWLQRLMSLGLLRAAWRPGDEVCVVRAVVRQRDVLLTEQGTWVQRMQKALVQMNIQLTEVLSDVMGMTGQAIIRDIVAGERDPLVLARHHNRRIKASTDEVTKALTGNWRDEHLFLLMQSLAIFDDLAKRVQECDSKIEALLAPLQRHTVKLKASLKGKGKNNPSFDVRQAMANWAGVDLTRIDGLGQHRDEAVVGDRRGPQPLRQRQALLFLAWPVPWHEDQRWQGAGGRHQAIGQSRPPGAEDGRHEPVAQRLGTGCVLPSPVLTHGQAQGQHRRRPQALPNGLLHADARRGVCRPRP